MTSQYLHVAQPTVSYNLRRLRWQFADDLFHRTGNGLAPTAEAQRLYEPMRMALDDIDEAVNKSRTFDPATATVTFTLALSDLGEVTLLPRLVAAARIHAPGISFTIQPFDTLDAEQQLGRGELDAFIATPVITSDRTARIPLFGERYIGIVSSEHPRIRDGAIDLRALRRERFATVFGPSGHVGPRAALEANGLVTNVALEVTRFSMLPYLVEQTDLVAIMPQHAAEVFTAIHQVRLIDLPFETAPIEVAAYARLPSARSAAQRWLIDFVHEVLGRRADDAGVQTTPASHPNRAVSRIVR